MKALCWHGKGDIRFETVPDPKIENPRDAIIKVSSTAICGSDLHIYGGVIPTMKSGDVVGHDYYVNDEFGISVVFDPKLNEVLTMEIEPAAKFHQTYACGKEAK